MTHNQKNNDDDDQSKTEAAAIAAIVVVVAMLVFPLVFMPTDGPWLKNVKDFQTLFAGILAVMAAWLTVLQMRKTDEKSALRHDELIRLQTRPDALKIERLLNPTFGMLRVDYKLLRDVQFEASDNDEDKIRRLQSHAVKMMPVAKSLQQKLAAQNWTECSQLFGASLNASLAAARSSAANLGVSCLYIMSGEEKYRALVSGEPLPKPLIEIVDFNSALGYGSHPDRFVAEYAAYTEAFPHLVETTMTKLEVLFQDLYKMETVYRIP